MKTIVSIILTALLLMGGIAGFAEEAAAGLQKDLVILFILSNI